MTVPALKRHDIKEGGEEEERVYVSDVVKTEISAVIY